MNCWRFTSALSPRPQLRRFETVKGDVEEDGPESISTRTPKRLSPWPTSIWTYTGQRKTALAAIIPYLSEGQRCRLR